MPRRLGQGMRRVTNASLPITNPPQRIVARKSGSGVPRYRVRFQSPGRTGLGSNPFADTSGAARDRERWHSEDGRREHELDRRTGVITTRAVEVTYVANRIAVPAQTNVELAPVWADRAEARERLRSLDGWIRAETNGSDTFSKEYVFRDFKQAWEFMSIVAVKLENMNHHPDWRHVKNKVTVTLPSPAVSGLSTKDSSLAAFMDEVARDFSH